MKSNETSDMEEERTSRWKKAHKSEFKFYSEMKREWRYSKDYVYDPQAWSQKFEWWGFKDFDTKSFLEVGSGLFGPLHAVRGRKTLKVGIDPLIGTLYKEFAAKDIHYIRSVGERLPFYDKEFDVVICYNVLDHVINPFTVLNEIRRVLKDQGLFFFCVNVHPRALTIFNSVLNVIDREHPYHFGWKQVKRMVESVGFDTARVKIVDSFEEEGTESKIGVLKRIILTFKWKAFLAFFYLRTLYMTAAKSTR